MSRQSVLAFLLVFLTTFAGVGNVWGADSWVQVTSALTDWSGEYLIVYQGTSTTEGVAWTGVDAANCNVAVTISSGVISTKPSNAASVTIASMTGGYSLVVNGGTNDGKYMKNASNNGITFQTSAQANTLTYENNAVTITCGSKKFRYNNTNNNYRFRYFGSDQQVIQLYKKQSGSSNPAVSLNPTNKEFEATGNSAQEIALSTSNFASAVNSVTCAFYSEATCDNLIDRPTWVNEPTVNNEKTKVTVNVADNDGNARQTWMKITASDGSKSASAVFAISQKKYSVDYATLPFEYDGNGSGDLPNGFTNSGVGTYNASPAMKFDGTGDYIIIHFNTAPGTLSYTIKGNGFSGGTFTVQESADGETYTEVESYTTLGDAQNEEHDLNSASRYVKFIYTNKSSGNVALGNIAISEYVAPAAVAKPTISGEDNFLISTTVTLGCATDGATIYYTTDGTDPKTSGTKQTYSNAFDLTETATVRAIANLGEDWSEEATQKTFSRKTPITVAQALAIINDLTNKTATTEDYLVEGTISTITSVTVGGTAEYYISADGTTTTQLQVYKGKYKNQANFASTDDIQVGDDVVIFGKLKKYNDYKELDANNYVYSQKAKARLSWSAASYDAELGGSNTFPTLTNTNNVTVTYSSSDVAKASFTDENDYSTLQLNAVGQTTITATFAGNESYKANSVSYTLNVAAAVARGNITYHVNGGSDVANAVDQTELPDPLPTVTKGGKNFGGWYKDSEFTTPAVAGASIDADVDLYAKWLEPYTVAQARAAIDASEGVTGVYATGIVSEIVTAYSSQHGNITYNISADGLTTSDQLQAYRGKAANGDNFTSASDVQVGDVVVVYGNLTQYGDTYEFEANNQLYSLTRKEDAGLAWSAASAVVGITGDKNYPNLTNPNTLEVTYQSTDEDVATIAADGTISLVAAGETTIKAIFAGNASYKAATVTYELEVRETLVYASITYVENGANEDLENVPDATNLPNPLPTVTKDGARFGGWFTDDTFETPAVAGASLTENVTLYAKWDAIPTFNDPNHEWQLVTSEAQLVAGKYYVIAYSGNNHTMKYADSGTYYETVSSTVSDNVIAYDALGASTAIFELGGTSTAWTLTEAINDVQLGANSNKNMVWGTNTTWTIAIDEDNNATITNVTTNHVLCYNNSANPKRFKVYDAASNTCPLPQLYVWAEKTYKLRYDANGGENAPAAQPAVAGQATVTDAEPTAPEGKVFDKWTIDAEGQGTVYAAGAEVTISDADVTLFAQWRDAETVTISYDANGGEGTMAADAEQVEGSTYTIKTNAFELSGYLFAGWKAYDINNDELTITNGKFTVPATDVTVKAQWQSATDSKWVLVEHLSQLADGDKVIIAAKDYGYALSTTQNKNNRGAVEISKSGKLLIPNADVQRLTLGKDGSNYTFHTDAGYLYAASSGSNYLRTQETNDNNGKWTITLAEGGVATITAQGSNTCNVMSYNTSHLFACYASDNTQKDIVIYKYLDMDPTDETSGYERTDLILSGIGTICLPYNVEASDRFGGVFYMPSHKTSGFANFIEETGTLRAGKAYIFVAENEFIRLKYSGAEVSEPLFDVEDTRGLIGTFTGIAAGGLTNMYVIADNKLRKCGSVAYLNAYRAYLDLDVMPEEELIINEPVNAPARRRLGIGGGASGVTTDIEDVQGDSLSGIKVLLNGQLFIIRGEKMYDATGRLVK